MPEPTPDCRSDQLPSFEEALSQLVLIVKDLEDGQIGLAQALARYEEGVKLLKQCYGLLEHAECRIELLTGVDAAGNPQTEPFDDASDVPLDEKPQARSQRRSKPGGASRRPTVASDQVPSDMDGPPGLF